MELAWLFPGQGSQTAGYLHRLPEHEQVRATLAQAAQVLGTDPLQLDRPEALRSTVAVQLGLLIAGVAQARVLDAEGLRPDVVAGLSVGAFGAAVASGCLDFADALRLVRLRAQGMEREFPRGWGMLSVSGLRESALQALLDGIQAERPQARLYLANLNSASQFVVAGADPGLDGLQQAARRAGARQVERLDVAVPSHCEPLEPVSRELAQALQGLRLREPDAGYMANTTARLLRSAADIARDLAEGVMRPVRWHDSNRGLLERGVRCLVEMPPGQALTRMVSNLNCQVVALAAESMQPGSLVLRIRRACSGGPATPAQG